MTDTSDPGDARVAYSPVKDTGGAPAVVTDTDSPPVPAGSDPDPTRFRFDLDNALARLSEPHLPIPRFKWSTVTPSTTESSAPLQQGPVYGAPMAPGPSPSAPLPGPAGATFPDQTSRVRPLTQPTLDPVPEIREATRVDGTSGAPHWSAAQAPALDLAPAPAAARAPVAAPAAAPAFTIVTGTDAFAAGVSGFRPDMPDPTGAWTYGPVGDGPPRLPDSSPAAAPPMATMTTALVLPKVSAAAAARVRKQHKRRRNVRVMMVLLLLAGLVGGALKYGRSYLFPAEWAEEVVPAVEALQLSSGLEFTDPVTIVVLPDVEYATKVAGIVFTPAFGAAWTTSVPRWRALGLVGGEPTVDSVNAIAGAWMPVHYDSVAGQIYRNTTATGPTFEAAMRDSLTSALIDQQTPDAAAPAATAAPDPAAPTVTAPATASLANLAIADLVVELVAGPTDPPTTDPSTTDPATTDPATTDPATTDPATTSPDRAALSALPVPMAHRLIGAEDLGAPILGSLGVVPDRPKAIAGFGVDVAAVLDVPWTTAPVPAMIAGDLPDGAAAIMGSDFWYMVLAEYLPATTAADAANVLGADLYTPAVRGVQQCVYGTFTPATPEMLGALQISLAAWAELAPTQAAAQATTLADGVTVQLSTCDPGTAADATPMPDVASALVARQIARLTPA